LSLVQAAAAFQQAEVDEVAADGHVVDLSPVAPCLEPLVDLRLLVVRLRDERLRRDVLKDLAAAFVLGEKPCSDPLVGGWPSDLYSCCARSAITKSAGLPPGWWDVRSVELV
jgi:hypothetical protein